MNMEKNTQNGNYLIRSYNRGNAGILSLNSKYLEDFCGKDDKKIVLIYTDSNPLENDFDQAAKLGIYLSKNTSFEVYLSTDKNSKLENYSDSVIHKGEVNGIKSKKDLENLINSIENMEMEAVA